MNSNNPKVLPQVNIDSLRTEYNSKYVTLSDEGYKEIGVQFPENFIKNLSIDQSKDMSPELANWVREYEVPISQIKLVHPDLHDMVVTSKSDKLIRTLLNRYQDCIKEVIKEGEGLSRVYKEMAKDYESRINEIGASVKRCLSDGFVYDPLFIDFEKDLDDKLSFDFLPKKNLMINLYKNAFNMDLSILDDKSLRAIYDINHDFDPSFKRLVPLDGELQSIHNFYSKQHKELQGELKKIDIALNETSNPDERYALSHKFLKLKREHVDVETVLRSTVVLYRGLNVISSAEFNTGSFKLHYDIDKAGELKSTIAPPQNVPEI